ncbi:HAMP domain-containing sensor histidine kinase [Actinomadura sp. DC4]|uniref:sensor histidine kinase n=1 Tax=Actinomadura sp. DC4 TaxID=3055069 RepID=UPI0025B17DB0|nr:HAMP domain-containing sensor histidine kinase [Actinomadura sp. DC4]MDN3360149.1 HAMP domain-containing sensor histidine kinase [Actinomadura sp. DC4]
MKNTPTRRPGAREAVARLAGWRPTFRMRLTLLYGGLFFVAGTVLLVVTYVLVGQSLRANPNRSLVRTTNSLIGQYQVAPGSALTGGEISGTPPPSPLTSRTRITAKDAAAFREQIRQVQEKYEESTLNTLLTQGGIALGLVGAAAVGLGWLMAGRALRPVHQVTETARLVARSHVLTERIGYEGPRDDIKELADTFDHMLARLARAFDGQRRFVANASHELRTPLAINRTLVEVAVRHNDATADVRRLGESLLLVNARHERLIDGLLTLAGSEQEITDATPVDLAEVGAHVLDVAGPEAARKDVTLEHDLGPAPTCGDPVLLERLAQNLVENAIRHNRRGGRLRLVTRAGRDGVELAVTNTGPTVPSYELDTIFEPFRRLRTERVGSGRGAGLGLSIVRAVATAHGGTASAAPREGGGLVVTVSLPRS